MIQTILSCKEKEVDITRPVNEIENISQLKQEANGVDVKSSISFVVAKVTDAKEATIKFNQEALPL